MTTSIAILIPYFGKWPPWINFFIETCRANPSINWILFSDNPPPENRARNVRHVNISFQAYKEKLSQAFGCNVSWSHPYKLCDIKPALAFVHQDLVAEYAFIGFGDIDVVYGNLRLFYDEETLAAYDALSAHRDRVSGHLFLMRNEEPLVTLFQRTPGWKDVLKSEELVGFDERGFFNVLRARRPSIFQSLTKSRPRALFRESYSTPAATRHMRWYWKDGTLTNEFYPHHPFMYLHFMSWHSNRWYADQPGVSPTAAAPWMRLSQIVQMDWREARKEGFMISPAGIQPIERATYD